VLEAERSAEPPVDEALAALRSADPPGMFDELAERGLGLLEQGQDLAEAQSALERAMAIRSEDPEVAYGLGVIYGRLALGELERARRSPFLDQTAAESLLAKAIFCYQRSVELDPKRAEAWNNLAALHAVRGDRELAIEALKRSLQASPDQPPVRERLEELGAF
jgi:Flp pilus assembly protein TadD